MAGKTFHTNLIGHWVGMKPGQDQWWPVSRVKEGVMFSICEIVAVHLDKESELRLTIKDMYTHELGDVYVSSVLVFDNASQALDHLYKPKDFAAKE